MPEISAIVVNHRSAAEAAGAVANLRSEFREANRNGEVILVDCGSGPEERPALEAIGADRLLWIENRGYSGGLNAGISAARSRVLLFCNADVGFGPGSLAPLLEAIEDPATAAAAPVQHADDAGRVLLPTGFGAGFGRDLAQGLGDRAPGKRSRFARHAVRQWRLWTEGGETEYLAGSILATRRDVVDAIGRFDERFLFEYEETEWEDRARRAGYRLRVVAPSRVRHRSGVSSAKNPGTGERRRAARELYRRRRFGTAGRTLLAWAERAGRTAAAGAAPARFEEENEARALAVSPNPSMLPFAGVSLTESVETASLTALFGAPLFAGTFRVRDGDPGPLFRIAS
jgi:GT2 family glycosyltransferase